MEHLSRRDYPAISFLPSSWPRKLKLFFFLIFGLVILNLFLGIASLKEKSKISKDEDQVFVSKEEELRVNITNLSSPVDVESVFGYLEKIKEHHGSDDWMDQSSQYMNYLGVVSSLRGSYYASGGSPETRNSEILEVLAQFREMARENPYFHEEDWGVEGIGGYWVDR